MRPFRRLRGSALWTPRVANPDWWATDWWTALETAPEGTVLSTVSNPLGLQAALDAAADYAEANACNVTLPLDSTVTFVGNYTLKTVTGGHVVTVRSNADQANLPQNGTRTGPAYAGYLPTIRAAAGGTQALATQEAASYWRLRHLAVLPAANGSTDTTITLGESGVAQNTVAKAPHHLYLRHVYHNQAVDVGQKRGIGLQSATTAIRDCYLGGCKLVGADTQSICGWNGPGPFLIENSFLEGAGENVMFGGPPSAIAALEPSHIIMRRNHFYKPLSWAGVWAVKNILEFKAGSHALMEGNVFENCWASGQLGQAVLLTPRCGEGHEEVPPNPWTWEHDIEFRHNIFVGCATGIDVMGKDYNFPAYTAGFQATQDIRIHDNLFLNVRDDVNGNGMLLRLLGNGPTDVSFKHNTSINCGPTFMVVGSEADPNIRPVVKDNMLWHEAGVHADSSNYGDQSIGRQTNPTWQNNVFGTDNIPLWSSVYTTYPSLAWLTQAQYEAAFEDFEGGNYSLAEGSPYLGAGTDGAHIGADMATLRAMTAGVQV